MARRKSRKGSRRNKSRSAGRSKPAQPPNALCRQTEDAVITAAGKLPPERPLTKAEDRSLLRKVGAYLVARIAADSLEKSESGQHALELAKHQLKHLWDLFS